MAAAAILDFRNFKIVMVGMVTSAKLRHCAKFCADRSNRCGDIMISLFFKMAAAAILEFLATVCKTVRSMLSVRCPVCLSVSLSVCSVRALWPNDWTDQDETRRAGRPRAWPHCVRWGPSSPPPKGHSPQFTAHISCGQMAAWIKMSLGTELGLGPGDFVLDGDPVPLPKRGQRPQIFGPCLLWPNGWMDATFTWHGGRP